MSYHIMSETLPVVVNPDTELVRAKSRLRYQKNRDKILAARRRVYIVNREQLLQQKREYYRQRGAEIRVKRRECERLHPEVKAKNLASARASANRCRVRNKLEALTHYGNGVAVCVRCGFVDVRALTIDHVNGGGRQHRISINNNHIYVWLRQQGYPSGYQTLCANCQMLKEAERRVQCLTIL